jgi:hypothetical protein
MRTGRSGFGPVHAAIVCALVISSGCGPNGAKEDAGLRKGPEFLKHRAVLARYCPAKRAIYMEDKFTVIVGNSRIDTNYAEISNGINLRKWVKSDFDIPLRIRIENGNVLLTTSFHGKKGDIAALIVDNQWVVNSENDFDRNSYGNTVEVVNKEGDPLVQVYVGDDNNILIGGMLYSPSMKLEPSRSGRSMILNSTPANPFSRTKQERIFKYPADRYPGVIE